MRIVILVPLVVTPKAGMNKFGDCGRLASLPHLLDTATDDILVLIKRACTVHVLFSLANEPAGLSPFLLFDP
jgi:hypothetical protein